MELVDPSVKYKDSVLAAAHEDFATFVQALLDRREGKGLPVGYVPDSIFWLVDGGEYIGRASIRHSLTEHLLKYGGHIGYNIRPSK